jgi:tetratricopeptide (TPR) repeat protein
LDCPYKLQGCPAKVPRCDLTKHKQSCPYSLEKLANKQQQKLTELKTLLSEYVNTKSRASDNALYDLAKLFHEQHAYTEARQCFEMMTTKNSSSEMVILQAQIERDDGQYNKALRLYDQADSTATPVSQRIDLLIAKGHMFVKMAKYIEAKDAFTHALDILPNDNQSQTQKKAEILNSIGLVAKKCSDVSIISYN